MNLTNHQLLKNKTLIDGKWVGANDGKTFPVYNPYDGSHIGDVPDMGAAETKAAISAAAKAFPAWRGQTAANRAAILKKWYALQMEHLDDLAVLLTTEQGKPLAEAKGEIRYGASFVEWFAEEARRVYGDVIPGHESSLRIITIRQPIGVAAAITPVPGGVGPMTIAMLLESTLHAARMREAKR